MSLSTIGRIAVLITGTLLLPGLAWSAGPTARDKSGGKAEGRAVGQTVISKARFFSANGQVDNNTAAFVTVANTTIITTGTQCVQVQYSGEVALSGTPEGQISGGFRTLFDGALMQGHSVALQNFVSPDDNGLGRFEIVAFHHWRCGITSGSHTIQVQMRPENTSITMHVRGRSLTALFR